MNTSELMIGDWVKFNNSDLAHKVIAIAGKSIKVDKVHWYSANKFRPIPLTPEILEKNGLNLIHGEPNCFDEDRCYRVELTLGTDGTIRWTINISEYEILPLSYVHQLQHVLRLCGIEKEIVL